MTDHTQNVMIQHPPCTHEFTEPFAALSRTDNETLICPACGTREALREMGLSEERIEQHVQWLASLQTAYEAGREAGYQAGREESFEEAVEEAHEEGVEEGFEEGDEKGFEAGYEKGFEEGCEKGFEEGREKGFEQGYERALEEQAA